MSTISDYKEKAMDEVMNLTSESQEVQDRLMKYYEKCTLESVARELIRQVKTEGEQIYSTMQRRGYGLGEVGYYFKENRTDLIEDLTYCGVRESQAKIIAMALENYSEAVTEALEELA